jgi:hypothetical protein
MFALEIIKFIHFLIDIAISSYVFMFSPIYDIYYALFVLIQTLHWAALKNECIITYIEKLLIDPNYELGSDIKYQPHTETYHNDITLVLKAVLIIGTLSIIMYRSKNKYAKIFAALAIILWIYLTYFY